MILTSGGRFAGYGFYLLKGKPVFLWNLIDLKRVKWEGPTGIPAAKFWSITLYDNETRSMLQTPQKYPRAGSQSYPSPAAKPSKDGSTTVYIAPDQPEGVDRGN
jgi:hypothetical protein